jgi:AcrR family transcriptional regulator
MKEETRDCLWPASLPKLFVPSKRIERRDARENRQQILEVAQRLFNEHGVEAVSMHQIAVEAGIGQGTLYRRYGHKGELCMDLLYEHHRRFVEEIATFFSTAASEPALERLKDVLMRIIAFLEEQGALLGQIALTERRMPHPRVEFSQQEPSMLSFFNWLHELLVRLLTEAEARGELASLDVAYTADAMLATMYPPFYRFQRQERGFSSERILQGLCHIYIDGVKAPEI